MTRLLTVVAAIATLILTPAPLAAQSARLPPQAAQQVGGVRTTPAADRGRVVPGRFVVLLEPKADPNAVAREHGVEPRYVYTTVVKGFAGPISELARTGLLRDNRVRRIEPVRPVHATATASSWGIDRIDQRALPLNSIFLASRTGLGVTAYVVDTGIRLDHQMFAGRAVRGTDSIGDGQNGNDCNGHGTHVAGSIGGGYGYGVAPGVRLVSARVLDCEGSGLTSGVIAALDWIAKNGQRPGVVNMSLGGDPDSATDEAVRNLISAGFTVVVAAGNDGVDACRVSPARLPEAITVAASDESDSRPSWSNYGSCVNLFAPGDGIVSAYNSSSSALARMSGTSMAAPHVAGAAALQLEANSSASPASVASALYGAATKGAVSNASSSNNHLLYVGSESTPLPTPSATPTTGGATIQGTSGDDIINGSRTVAGQPLPTKQDDTIYGLAGNDRIDGSGGADRMEGGPGDDVYTVDNSGDTVVEKSGEGNDQVRSSVDYTLPANVERLILIGTAKLTGQGNGLNNVLSANAAGARLIGGNGDDLLVGGAGPDTLIGGNGSDTLKGSGGADRFMFSHPLGSTNIDRAPEFNPAEDKIYLSAKIFTAAGPPGTLAAAAFASGSSATSATQRIIYYPATGYVYYDPDGNGPAAKVAFVKLPAGLPLNNSHFVIY